MWIPAALTRVLQAARSLCLPHVPGAARPSSGLPRPPPFGGNSSWDQRATARAPSRVSLREPRSTRHVALAVTGLTSVLRSVEWGYNWWVTSEGTARSEADRLHGAYRAPMPRRPSSTGATT